jgi:hypothetical protein
MTNTLSVFDLKIFDLLFLELSQDKFFFAYVIFRGGSETHPNDEEDLEEDPRLIPTMRRTEEKRMTARAIPSGVRRRSPASLRSSCMLNILCFLNNL